jgi:hypothetical protein
MPRIRTLAVAALSACACLLIAAPAQAGKSHLTGLYKVEKHVDLDGEGLNYTISCQPGDKALDGMWRIDNVDQDNDYEPSPPPGFGTTGFYLWDNLESVFVDKAEATGAGTYTFSFTPLGGGDVQLKLWLVCLPSPTPVVSGHSHTWSVGSLHTQDVPLVAGGANTFTTTPDCDDFANESEIAIANGFDFTGGTAHVNQYKRVPDTSALHAYDVAFLSDSASPIPGNPVLNPQHISWRCLVIRSNAAGSPSHRHRLVYYHKSASRTLKKNLAQTVSFDCGDHYKAVIGTWDFGANYGFNKLWWLGMDPRPKTRAFKVLNADPANDYAADFGAVCLKDRTT